MDRERSLVKQNIETMTFELWCHSVCNPSVGAETKEKGYPRIIVCVFLTRQKCMSGQYIRFKIQCSIIRDVMMGHKENKKKRLPDLPGSFLIYSILLKKLIKQL
jgi:hypothetical protein